MDIDLTNATTEDISQNILRPQSFNDYIGQSELVDKLKIAIKASRERGDALDHILLTGPPGLGKSSLAKVISKECGTNYREVAAPSIRSTADVIGILKQVEDCGVLFLDECHGLNIRVEETLYTAMEDFAISVKINNNSIVNIPVSNFCLIGATTSPGKMSGPFRDRFGIQHTMQFYIVEELSHIVKANMIKLNLNYDESVVNDIAKRSRGTPRIVNRLLRRIRDYAQLNNNNYVDKNIVNKALDLEGVDKDGLTKIDKRYIEKIWNVFAGGPAGINAIASSCGDDKTTLEESVEPYLVRIGLISRTSKGRMLTNQGVKLAMRL
ncbi:MAG: Holliday junction ATP-dependent DNA helicase RuvB [Promethearchaeota archaeon]|nr:MAG: Holliday junction ATP-dependent DNA helicase RuvB [Candidatus Lokiarchaeota archaeon]